MIRYFIEHKESHQWLCITGDLTLDPNDIDILSYKERCIAELWIDKDVQFMVKDPINSILGESGYDLYKDFVVTEHEFVNMR